MGAQSFPVHREPINESVAENEEQEKEKGGFVIQGIPVASILKTSKNNPNFGSSKKKKSVNINDDSSGSCSNQNTERGHNIPSITEGMKDEKKEPNNKNLVKSPSPSLGSNAMAL